MCIMLNVLAVGIGGAIGAVFRYLLSHIIPKCGSGFPIGTFCINLLGCFIIGLITAGTEKYVGIHPRILLFLQTGLCGGFTTFSTFSLEVFLLVQQGKFFLAVFYMVSSMIIGVLLIFFARRLVFIY